MNRKKSATNASWSACLGLTLALVAGTALAQQPSAPQNNNSATTLYNVVDLGTLAGGASSQPFSINRIGSVSGASALTGGATHAVVWSNGKMSDLRTLGGMNSTAFAENTNGEAVGEAETSLSDPNGEDFCGFGTYVQCLPFRAQNGVMSPLPTLGGNNGAVNQVNGSGLAVGFAESGIPDPGCSSPQVLHFKPVVWTNKEAHQLPTYAGDPDGVALEVNDGGQVVGASGLCAPLSPVVLYLQPVHALLWDRNRPVDLGNLGGATGQAGGNIAWAINNKGQVIGVSDLPSDSTFHAFLWTRQTGMEDLGTLPGHVASTASGINDDGTVVGLSFDANFNGHAFIWQHGTMSDLNNLAPNSPMYLFSACGINAQGEIAGLGVTSTGEFHAYLATPYRSATGNATVSASPVSNASAATVTLSDHDRQMLQQQLRLVRRFTDEPPDPCRGSCEPQ
ncbi:MAG TPA: hypothetical protein VE779_04280 [Candidatus Angelobacter sp.]|nr:hypothetical protein [Candidatus Angelobacter sp.]